MRLYFQIRSAFGDTDAPTIVLLHYFGGSSGAWQHVGDELAELYPQCPQVALDLRGHGDSPDAATHTVAEMADDVQETLAEITEIGNRSLVIVGHSMGGKVAQWLAAANPSQVQGLALIAPSPPTGEPMSDTDWEKNVKGWGSDDASRKALGKITGLPVSTEDSDRFVQDRARTTQAAWIDWFTRGTREDIREQVKNLKIPITLLVGDKDGSIALDVQKRETLGIFPAATLTVVPGAGHLLPFEAPGDTAKSIASCVAQVMAM